MTNPIYKIIATSATRNHMGTHYYYNFEEILREEALRGGKIRMLRFRNSKLRQEYESFKLNRAASTIRQDVF